MTVFSRLLDFFDGGSPDNIASPNGYPLPQPSPRVENPIVVNDDSGKTLGGPGGRPPIVFTNGMK